MRSIPLLLTLLCFKALAMILLVIYGAIDLVPDEVQYWTWAKALDFGYYSKPPGIAYQMALSTKLLGDTELGIRAGALVVAFLLPLLVYAIGKRCDLSDKGAFWAAIAMASCPIGMLASLLATTDSGFLLCWTVALLIVTSSLKQDKALPPLRLGVVVFCGALFKWPMYWFWAVVFLGAIFFPKWRSKNLIFAVLISLFAFLPSVIWNIQHDWATFRHVGSTLLVPEGTRKAGNPLEFFAAQIGLLTPIFFVLWLVALFRIWKRREHLSNALLFCSVSSAVIVIVHIGIACTKKMQGNWCVWAYPAAMIPIGWMAEEMTKRTWHKVAATLSVLILVVAFSLPTLQQRGSLLWLPHKSNPWRHALGWSALPEALKKAGWRADQDFLFADRYQTASLMSLYNSQKERGYFFNLSEQRRNQFSYWGQMKEERLGKTGYFVWIENSDRIPLGEDAVAKRYQKNLEPYFSDVTVVGTYPLWQVGNRVDKIAILLRCDGYNGLQPDRVERY